MAQHAPWLVCLTLKWQKSGPYDAVKRNIAIGQDCFEPTVMTVLLVAVSSASQTQQTLGRLH